MIDSRIATSKSSSPAFKATLSVPGLLVAFPLDREGALDRIKLQQFPFTVGRSSNNDLSLLYSEVTKKHFVILHKPKAGHYSIRDCKSKNGTFVDGDRVQKGKETMLKSGAVIRAGQVVLVFHEDAGDILKRPEEELKKLDREDVLDFIKGQFHAIPLIKQLQKASKSSKHILLVGETGTGKELAAKTLALMMGGCCFKKKNCAEFATDDEAKSTILGVAGRVFSQVDPRPGLIEDAKGGLLFLDEIQDLSKNVQGTLLRVLEDGKYTKVGDPKELQTDARFIFATNDPTKLRNDFEKRLRVVTLPCLSERKADIPSIFVSLLETMLENKGYKASEVRKCLDAYCIEKICLDDFKDEKDEPSNVRGLVDIADCIVTTIIEGTSAAEAVNEVFAERYYGQMVTQGPDASHYERHKELIISFCYEHNGNISAIKRDLDSKNIKCSRRWLTYYLKKWGLK